MINPEKIARLEALYARIPKMKNCNGKCEDSCTVIPVTPLEKERLEAAMGRVFGPVGLPPGKVRCSALVDGKCSQYDIRPFICRAFGVVNHPFMKCEYGCKPERWLSGIELYSMINELHGICGEMVTPCVPGWPRLSEEQGLEGARLLLSGEK